MVKLKILAVCIGLILLLDLVRPANGIELSIQNENQIATNISGYSYQEALRLGERIYREGILHNGQTMTAFVQGDIPVDGREFTCMLCHRRSGLGTSEGYIVALPVNGANLFRSRRPWDTRRRHSRATSLNADSRKVPASLLGKEHREAYTDETLASAIRSGVDPAGRKLDQIMPRYDLNKIDMALLINYLKNLTANLSPGVTDDKLHFATIVTQNVDKIGRDAMLSVLQTHIKDKNSQTRNQLKRSKNGAFNRREIDSSYRILELSVWELTGPEETWGKQLEAFNVANPVFAILGGMVEGDWAPIHDFSEMHNIPVLFPVTEKPVISTENWNTFYFSKGLYQEGESAARFIRRNKYNDKETHIIQVFRKGSDGEVIANGFKETWNSFGLGPVINFELKNESKLNNEYFKNIHQPDTNTILLFWGGEEEVISTNILEFSKAINIDVFVSSRLLHANFDFIDDESLDSIYITYPYSLPGSKHLNSSFLKTWLNIKKIPITDLKIQSEMYFVGWVLSDLLTGIKGEFYRDYFIERMEMMKDQTHVISAYPRLSLGPNQRYASKGCYIVQLSKGDKRRYLQRDSWIVY